MERVTGIGGFFFRARDPQALKTWYEQQLGMFQGREGHEGHENEPWWQEAVPTAFQPFVADTDYFGRPEQMWMVTCSSWLKPRASQATHVATHYVSA